MDDLIDRQAAIDAAKDWYEGMICGSIKGLIKRLNALPTIQPVATDTNVGSMISRQAAIDQLHQSYNLLDAEQRLEGLPSAQPKRQTGHWERVSADRYIRSANHACKCSRCGAVVIPDDGWCFCPACGASMEGTK